MIDKLAEGIDKHLPKIIDSGLEIILKLVNLSLLIFLYY